MTTRKFTYATVGSISTGTMREEDLIPAFCYELKRLAKANRNKAHLAMVEEIESALDQNAEEYVESGDASYDLNERLVDALQSYAPAYFYFGFHPGDGADYGFWLSEFMEEEFDGLKVNDLSEVPAKYKGEVLHVNDHGNVSLYVKSARKLTEVWAVV